MQWDWGEEEDRFLEGGVDWEGLILIAEVIDAGEAFARDDGLTARSDRLTRGSRRLQCQGLGKVKKKYWHFPQLLIKNFSIFLAIKIKNLHNPDEETKPLFLNLKVQKIHHFLKPFLCELEPNWW